MKLFAILLLLCVTSAYAQNWGNVWDAIKDAGVSAANSGKAVLEKAIDQIKVDLDNLKVLISKMDISGRGKRDLEQLNSKFEKFKQLAVERLTALFKLYAQRLQQLFPKLVLDFENGKREVEVEKNEFQKALDEALKHLQDILGKFVTGGLDKLKETVNGKRDVADQKTITDFFTDLAVKLQGHVSNVSQKLVDHGKNLVDTLKPHVDDAKNKLLIHGLDVFLSVWNTLESVRKSISEGKRDVADLKEQLKGHLDEGLKHLQDILAKLSSGTFEKLLEALNGAVGKRDAADLKEQLKGHLDEGLKHLQDILAKLSSGTFEKLLEALNGAIGKRDAADLKEQLKGHLDEGLKHLQDILAKLSSGTFEKLLEALNGAVGKRDAVSDNFFKNLVDQLKGHLDNIGKTVSDHASTTLESILKPALQDLQDKLAGHANDAVKSLLETLASLSSNIGKREDEEEDNRNPLSKIFKDLLAQFQGHVSNVGNTLKDHTSNIVESILKPHLDDLKAKLVGHGLDAVQSVIKALGNASQQLGKREAVNDNFFANLLKQLQDQLDKAGKALQDHSSKVVEDILKPHLDDLKDKLAGHANDAIQSFLESLASASQKIGKREVVNQNFLTGLLNTLQGHFTNVSQKLAEHTQTVLNDILKPHLDELKTKLVGHGLEAVQSLLDTLANASKSLGSN